MIVDFDNRLSCYFEARIRINGDHRDHLDFAPSLDIELIIVEKEEDSIEKQNKEVMEKDYEASFPGLDK